MPGSKGPHHTDAWRRCITDVEDKVDNPYAVCTQSLERTDNVYETREAKLMKKATKALDDANGDRGDVAPPAVHMPRANGHSGVPGGQQPAPEEGHTPWEIPARCPTCGQATQARMFQTKLCDCGASFGDMVADTDEKAGLMPVVQDKVGAQYQAPPPPGPPMRMDNPEGHNQYSGGALVHQAAGSAGGNKVGSAHQPTKNATAARATGNQAHQELTRRGYTPTHTSKVGSTKDTVYSHPSGKTAHVTVDSGKSAGVGVTVWHGQAHAYRAFGGRRLKNVDPNVGGGVDRDKLPDSDFAGPGRPIVKPGDVQDAASSIGRSKKASPDTLKKNIKRIAKRKGPSFEQRLPAAWKPKGGK